MKASVGVGDVAVEEHACVGSRGLYRRRVNRTAPLTEQRVRVQQPVLDLNHQVQESIYSFFRACLHIPSMSPCPSPSLSNLHYVHSDGPFLSQNGF